MEELDVTHVFGGGYGVRQKEADSYRHQNNSRQTPLLPSTIQRKLPHNIGALWSHYETRQNSCKSNCNGGSRIFRMRAPTLKRAATYYLANCLLKNEGI